MITGVGSVAILAHDAKKSAEWYRDKLGFEIVGIEGHTVFVRLSSRRPWPPAPKCTQSCLLRPKAILRPPRGHAH